MGKLGFFLSVILVSAVVTSLIVNAHLLATIDKSRDEFSELQQYFPTLEFQTISKGYSCTHKTSAYYVIEDESEWTILWNHYIPITEGQLTYVPPKPPPPEIDFSNTTVIAVFMGECPTSGYGIEIKGIINLSQNVVVMVDKKSPGKGCVVLGVLTSPYHIVKMNKVDEEITFETVERTIECP